jgi:hypothetical protein
MTDDTPRPRPNPAPAEPDSTVEDSHQRWTTTRTIAVLFLIPSIPMLLGSVAALALFYVAPVRFGGLIARLPADEFIRTVLFFAPATLFALVVLAFLYAREPAPPGAATEKPPLSTVLPPHPARTFARWVLGLITPAFLFAVLVLLLSLVAPGRFSNWIEPLPGDRLLRPLVPVAPVILFAAGLIAWIVAFPRRREGRAEVATAGPANTVRGVVGIILVSSLAMLAMSLVALGISYARPDRFQRLMSRLDPDTFVRLALLFAPATLTAVVILALLYLIGRSVAEPAVERSARPPSASASARSTLAVSVLIGGLLLSTIVALGLLAVLFVLLLR